jgi:hypothetical protein
MNQRSAVSPRPRTVSHVRVSRSISDPAPLSVARQSKAR